MRVRDLTRGGIQRTSSRLLAVTPDYLTSQIENANLPMVQSTLIIGGMEKDDDRTMRR